VSETWQEAASQVLAKHYPEGMTVGMLAGRVEERVSQALSREDLARWLAACERDGTADEIFPHIWRAGRALMKSSLKAGKRLEDYTIGEVLAEVRTASPDLVLTGCGNILGVIAGAMLEALGMKQEGKASVTAEVGSSTTVTVSWEEQ
jgi:hypothetical protein